ncbi:hypothetical protein TeGR_g8818 [Tetraparma gracilis]|uniref:Uncharacterized protein n=1 Tax=Tetraparma gracilis TaxID=2962635 RepID=A0ABQ6N7A1_9STRA|nr:hypothetical protein TeGR_g8818 [Tetraparma gracilis]
MNADPPAALELAELTGLPPSVSLLCDPAGAAGRAFGACRGWLPDSPSVSPYAKLLGMLLGLGAPMTLPAVVGGYLGNPFSPQPWIGPALAENSRRGFFPASAVELSPAPSSSYSNKFGELPLVGGWPRRPLELATLRLQNMLGISLANWSALKPRDENLGVLTQLGGCAVVDGGGRAVFEFRDRGICDVCNFEAMFAELDAAADA